VALSRVSSSSLTFVSMMCALFAVATVLAWSGCDVAWLVLLDAAPTLDSARAANIPWMVTVAGSMHTRDGMSFLLSRSSLAVTTWRHLGAMVTSCHLD
jgi:hypothetical protein